MLVQRLSKVMQLFTPVALFALTFVLPLGRSCHLRLMLSVSLAQSRFGIVVVPLACGSELKVVVLVIRIGILRTTLNWDCYVVGISLSTFTLTQPSALPRTIVSRSDASLMVMSLGPKIMFHCHAI